MSASRNSPPDAFNPPAITGKLPWHEELSKFLSFQSCAENPQPLFSTTVYVVCTTVQRWHVCDFAVNRPCNYPKSRGITSVNLWVIKY